MNAIDSQQPVTPTGVPFPDWRSYGIICNPEQRGVANTFETSTPTLSAKKVISPAWDSPAKLPTRISEKLIVEKFGM